MSSASSPQNPLQSHPDLAWFSDHAVAAWCETFADSSRVVWGRMEGCSPPSNPAPVTAGLGDIQKAPVAAAGPDWGLIVWEAGSATGNGIAAAVVSPAGTPQPLSAVTVSAGPGCRRPAVAIAGSKGLILWEEIEASGSALRYARWDRDGGLLDSGGVAVPTSGRVRFHPRVTGGSDRFFAVWSEPATGHPTGIYGGTWHGDGGFDTLVGQLSDPGEVGDNPDVAVCATGFLTAWNRLGSPPAVEGRFSDGAGQPQGSVLSLVSGPDSNFIPRLGGGIACELVWSRQSAAGRSLRRAQVDAAGTLNPPDGQELTAPGLFAADAALATGGAQGAALWRVPTPEDTDSLAAACWFAPVAAVEPVPRATLTARPNPFRIQITLALAELPETPGTPSVGTPGEADVFDIKGRLLRTLALNDPGVAIWDGRTESGAEAPAGRYLIRISPWNQTFSVTKLR